MKRAQQSLNPLQPEALSSSFKFDSALFSTPSHDTACATFVPMHYEAGYAYPLIVWLHGRGGNERQLMRVMPMVSMRNYVAVAPRGTSPPEGKGAIREAFEWRQTEEHIQEAEQRVFDAIESARRKLHIARQRTFLAGFGCGGTMGLRVAMDHPGHFAGVVSFAGAFPHGRAPFGRLAEVRRLPLLLAVGRDSRLYPSAKVCADLRLLHTAGLSITLRQYPGGDEISPHMLADMDRWIIDQITSAPNPATASDRQRSWERE